jgi:hypothetical protein
MQPYSNPAPPRKPPGRETRSSRGDAQARMEKEACGVKILRWTGHAIATAASLFCVAAIWCLDCTMRALMGGDQ